MGGGKMPQKKSASRNGFALCAGVVDVGIIVFVRGAAQEWTVNKMLNIKDALFIICWTVFIAINRFTGDLSTDGLVVSLTIVNMAWMIKSGGGEQDGKL